MIIDSSAIITVLLKEPGHERVVDHLAAAPRLGIGAPTKVETGMVLVARLGIGGKTLLAGFLQETAVETVPFTDEHWSVAVNAFARFGKGRHPAALNFGDCLTYATASVAREPLLSVGEDFRRTDLQLVP